MSITKWIAALAFSACSLLYADSEECSMSGPNFTGSVSCLQNGFDNLGNGPYLAGVTNGNSANLGGNLFLYQATPNNTSEYHIETVNFDDVIRFQTKAGDVLVVNAQYSAAVSGNIEDFTTNFSIGLGGKSGVKGLTLDMVYPLIDGKAPACYHDTCTIIGDALPTDAGQQYIQVKGMLMEKIAPGEQPYDHIDPGVMVSFGVEQFEANGVTPETLLLNLRASRWHH